MTLNIQQITIRNILGVRELTFEAGKFNEISGPNGAGKTSVLEAIKAATQGGHDATLLTRGETEGEVVLVLDDNSTIRRRVTADSSKTDLLRDGKKQPRAVESIKALTDALSVNPVDFLRATAKDRARVLLEAMPLQADTEKLSQMSGLPVSAQPGVHALQVIEQVRKEVYDLRTGTNRAVKEKEGTINQLRNALPEAPGGVDGDEDQLRAKVAAADQAKLAEMERIGTKLAGLRTKHQADQTAARAAAQAEIDAIKQRLADTLAQMDATFAQIEQAAAAQRERTITSHAQSVAPLNEAIAGIVANRDAAAKRQSSLKIIEQMAGELEDLQKDAERQSESLAAIDAYKMELLANLPIPGLTVVDGEIQRDGVPFDRLNTAQQVEVAVEVAKLRAGALGIICVDGLELLDSKTFDAFRERALESGLQLFVSRVSDGQFGIEVTD